MRLRRLLPYSIVVSGILDILVKFTHYTTHLLGFQNLVSVWYSV
jgi:hypothetical protein